MKNSRPNTKSFTRPSLLVLALLAAPSAFGQVTETEAALLHSPSSLPAAQFGADVDVSGPWAIVGDLRHVFFYRRWEDGWRYAGMDRGPQSSGFGNSVSTDGETLAVGAFKYGFPNPFGRGHVRVYELVNDRWASIQEIDPPSFLLQQQFSLNFGHGVAVDGEVMAIGAPGWGLPIEKAGMILIYERIGGDWCRVARFGQESITGPSGHPGEHVGLGSHVAVSGNTIAASASGGEGAVYLFEREAGTWRRTAMLYEVNPPDEGSGFGTSVAISEDERTVVLGQPAPGTAGFGHLPGRAHVFEKSLQGSWTRTAVLHASDEFVGSASGSFFGGDVAIEGDRIVVGSSGAKGNPAIPGNEGAVYLFERLPNGTWPTTETRRWFASDAQNVTQWLGWSVAFDRGFVVGTSFDAPAHVFEVGVGTELCGSTPNSTGEPGRMTVVGGPAEEMSFTLSAHDCPANNRRGFFLASLETAQVLLGNGILCLGNPIVRLGGVSSTGPTGTAFYSLEAADPQVRAALGLGPGTTLHLQYWFSDTVGAGSNLTNAVSVTVE